MRCALPLPVSLTITAMLLTACNEGPAAPTHATSGVSVQALVLGPRDGSGLRLSRTPPVTGTMPQPEMTSPQAVTFDGMMRYPAETRTWVTLPDGGDAYYRNVQVELNNTLVATRDGETWRVDLVHPDGFVETGVTVTYHEVWNGQQQCFVAGLSSLCGGTWAWLTTYVNVQCAASGTYVLKQYQDAVAVRSSTFVLHPQLPPGTMPLLSQLDYPNSPYDDICQGSSGSVPCTGTPGETRRTIAQKGCAITAAACMLGYFGVDTNPEA